MKKSVLILGAGLRTVVVIARSLHKRGIPVIVASMAPGEPTIKSSAIHKHVALPSFREKADQFITELIKIIQAEDIDMIIPAGDGAIAAVAQNYEELTKRVYVGSPPPLITERVLDKRLTLATAQKCGIPIASSRMIENISKIDNILEGLRFPLIAKPAIRKGANSYKIEYFITRKDLLDYISKDGDKLLGGLLQEYIPGIGKGIGVLMHKGEPLAILQHRRVKEYPYTGGVSVMAEAEPIDPILRNHAVTLLREIEWEGIAMVEYRYNPVDHTLALLEVNGRYWGSLFLADKAGMDFPYYEWQIAHGKQPDIPENYAVGMRVRWLAGDILRLHSILDGSHQSEITPVSRYKEITRFIIDSGFRTRDAVFSLNDPMPAIQELRETIGTLIKTDIKRLITKTFPPSLLTQIRIYRRLGSDLQPIFIKQQLRRLLGKQSILFHEAGNQINSILFVCLGNIIRSPTAAIILKHKLALTERSTLRVESAGLWEELTRINPRPSPEIVIKVAVEFGISLIEHRSQPITRELIESSDVIFVMDYQNEAMLLSRYPNARHKIFMLGASIDNLPLAQWEIADPYGKTTNDIRSCLSIIESRVQGLSRILLSGQK